MVLFSEIFFLFVGGPDEDDEEGSDVKKQRVEGINTQS